MAELTINGGHAEHVGSLLRPERLRAARHSGVVGPALRTIEDACIAECVAHQREMGLASVTDGEFRRGYWHYDFLAGLIGIDLKQIDADHPSSAGFVHRHRLDIHGPIAWSDQHPFIEDFRFLHRHAGETPARQTIPSPSVVHFRFAQQALAGGYEDLEELLADLTAAYSGAIRAFGDAGCRLLQLDEVNLAMLCDPAQVEAAKERGIYRGDLADAYADMINAVIQARPEGMQIAMHLCRGNFRSTSVASGGYEPVAELLFQNIDVDTYFLEFDTHRAGGFEPLRFVPAGHKKIVLGLLTSKDGTLEDRDTILRRIDAAAKFVPIEQLAISPQCGFASTEEGNLLTEADQWAKLRLCSAIAAEVWG